MSAVRCVGEMQHLVQPRTLMSVWILHTADTFQELVRHGTARHGTAQPPIVNVQVKRSIHVALLSAVFCFLFCHEGCIVPACMQGILIAPCW